MEGEVKFENDEHKNQYEGLPDEVCMNLNRYLKISIELRQILTELTFPAGLGRPEPGLIGTSGQDSGRWLLLLQNGFAV